jgi:hypothetical protein
VNGEKVKKEAEYCYKEYPTFCIPYIEYKKDVNFVSWEFAHKTITKKHHLCIYKLTRHYEKNYNEYINGEWEYIPLMSIYQQGSGILNRWIEIDYYSDKIFI